MKEKFLKLIKKITDKFASVTYGNTTIINGFLIFCKVLFGLIPNFIATLIAAGIAQSIPLAILFSSLTLISGASLTLEGITFYGEKLCTKISKKIEKYFVEQGAELEKTKNLENNAEEQITTSKSCNKIRSASILKKMITQNNRANSKSNEASNNNNRDFEEESTINSI